MPDDVPDHPPPPEQLGSVVCPYCELAVSAFTWPVTASLFAGDRSITAAVPERRERCPRCAEPLPATS